MMMGISLPRWLGPFFAALDLCARLRRSLGRCISRGTTPCTEVQAGIAEVDTAPGIQGAK
jgi:hypothetical protein